MYVSLDHSTSQRIGRQRASASFPANLVMPANMTTYQPYSPTSTPPATPPLAFDALSDEKYLKMLEQLNDEEDSSPEDILVCADCQHKITASSEKINVNGKHAHQLTNPYGIAFHVGCFNLAPGCLVFGDPTSAHSWFPSYYWQHAHCQGCQTHLGWLFTSVSNHQFFGLVITKLASISAPSQE